MALVGCYQASRSFQYSSRSLRSISGACTSQHILSLSIYVYIQHVARVYTECRYFPYAPCCSRHRYTPHTHTAHTPHTLLSTAESKHRPARHLNAKGQATQERRRAYTTTPTPAWQGRRSQRCEQTQHTHKHTLATYIGEPKRAVCGGGGGMSGERVSSFGPCNLMAGSVAVAVHYARINNAKGC